MCVSSRSVQRCLAAFSLLWMTACADNGVESAARQVQTDATINDRLWQLLRFEATKTDASYSITNSNNYTLILLTNGSYRVRADCNRMLGAYRLESEGGSIAIKPGAATLAECGPESHYSDYLRQLGEVRQFEVIEKTGQLNLITDTGQLIFEPAEPEAP